MPVNKDSTVEEVESYFTKFAQGFRSQVQGKDTPKLQEENDEQEVK